MQIAIVMMCQRCHGHEVVEVYSKSCNRLPSWSSLSIAMVNQMLNHNDSVVIDASELEACLTIKSCTLLADFILGTWLWNIELNGQEKATHPS